MEHSQIEILIEQRREKRIPYAEIKQIDATTLTVNGHLYELVANVRNAFDLGAFTNSFNPILTRYDYIIGDWGYGQLRLKGFFNDRRTNDSFERKSAINDYLLEEVNLGDNYFVLHNVDAAQKIETSVNPTTIKRSRKHHNSANRHIKQRHDKTKAQLTKRQFTIRQKKED
ncbi:Hypothetical DUF1027 protein [Fructilactobacillus florum 8D]|uniref:Hypothetical DUF1027 protein n=1 Tax=Fructilactobacillus florum 8D TaxID=1221538 RepID=W9EG24_9LACO|nr:YutD family protein [Fructilactobacillus florum]ETO39925.1 Hypothetical DUF1027 protein [Fructilactobacillus florum 8D]